jgi:alpha,alpha-trehalose phosphorylase
MRDYNGVITFDPRLPESWTGLTFQITLRGTRVKVEVTSREIVFTVVDGESAELAVRGDSFTVSAGRPVRVPLADQGLCIEGPLPSRTVDRRPDGTLITASVPQAVILGR